MGERIVVIAEKETQGRALCDQLQEGGYEAVLLPLSARVHLGLTELAPQMVIYNCQQCDGPNMAVVRRIRAVANVPLLVLGPVHSEAFVVNVLKEGADGCLCRPYGVPELLARVEALLRRHFQWRNTNRELTQGKLLFDELTHSVVANGREVQLTPTEYRLLRYLIGREGEVVTRKELRDCVWGTDAEVKLDRLDLYICSLRRKLERDPRRPQYIMTKRGIGYYLAWKAQEESSGSG